MYLYGNSAVLQQARIWLFSCFLCFLGDLHKSLWRFPSFLSAGNPLPPSACGPEMVQSGISSHARPTQTPDRFFGAHWSFRKSIQLFAQDEAFACEWIGLMCVKAAIDEYVHRRGRCPFTRHYWVPICVKLLLLKASHITLNSLNTLSTLFSQWCLNHLFFFFFKKLRQRFQASPFLNQL